MKPRLRRRKKGSLKIGEIIEIRSLLSMVPDGKYQVEGVEGDLIMLSAGDFRMGVTKDFVKITARNLPQPISWLDRELVILESMACECEECRKLLIQKRNGTGLSADTANQPMQLH